MAQRTQQQSLQGTAGVSLAGEPKRAKKAGKEDAKLKADPRGQTEKNREEADNHAKEARSTREADNSSLGRYVFGSEISYNKAPPCLPGLGC